MRLQRFQPWEPRTFQPVHVTQSRGWRGSATLHWRIRVEHDRLAEKEYKNEVLVFVLYLNAMSEVQTAIFYFVAYQFACCPDGEALRRLDIRKLAPLLINDDTIVVHVEEESHEDSAHKPLKGCARKLRLDRFEGIMGNSDMLGRS